MNAELRLIREYVGCDENKPTRERRTITAETGRCCVNSAGKRPSIVPKLRLTLKKGVAVMLSGAFQACENTEADEGKPPRFLCFLDADFRQSQIFLQ